MKLQKLHIKNFKSIVDLEIVEPNPFTVFVGPNGSGKSNIFEALEFINFISLFSGDENSKEVSDLFGGSESYLNRGQSGVNAYGHINFGPFNLRVDFKKLKKDIDEPEFYEEEEISDKIVVSLNRFHNFSRIFINSSKELKLNFQGDGKLNTKSSNLEKVLKRILQDEIKREEILEILELLIPELENIQIYTDSISGQETLLIKEKHTNKHFGKSLISDGTCNILCLLTALYQSDEPQFLCIEEPENGLNPYAIELLVELMRNRCQEKGHYIWLNTHSPTLVRNLRADELIVVDKKQGATQIKQFKGKDFFGLRMDEAWLTNALGGGLPW
ncbi:ATP-binding protein [Runella sp.]|uniref:AAA family ATPase n=1 Tax=Runella sp. TaxID=1960881 RepID=UPI00261A78D6|nr:ATP-binding protein [Runella sp.]